MMVRPGPGGGTPHRVLGGAAGTDESGLLQRRRTRLAGNLEEGYGFCLTNSCRERLNRELSHPVLHQGSDGTLDLAYTYFRETIEHVRVPAQSRQEAS
jgi:predicted neuraminidase